MWIKCNRKMAVERKHINSALGAIFRCFPCPPNFTLFIVIFRRSCSIHGLVTEAPYAGYLFQDIKNSFTFSYLRYALSLTLLSAEILGKCAYRKRSQERKFLYYNLMADIGNRKNAFSWCFCLRLKL